MSDEKSLIEVIDAVGPPLKSFDAFPKLPASYKSRTRYGGVLTVIVACLSVLLVLNDVAEYIWGWTDYEFSVDRDHANLVEINVDVTVNMPCQYLSVDVRDAVGDRLHLSDTFRRDGTTFDIGQAATLDEHRIAMSTREIVSRSRRSQSFFGLWKSRTPQFRPTYKHEASADACRVFGIARIKKVTGNLHITTSGHGYSGNAHVDHSKMNLSHVITELSFGPYFPDITQPLDYSYEVAQEKFLAYQYFISVVPTTYVAPRSKPLRTNQYSVTHYIRPLVHGHGTPGIFFKFDLDPLAVEVVQRTTSFTQFFIRVIGVIGGVWVCFGWGFKVATKVTAKAGILPDEDEDQQLVANVSSRKKRWGGSDLRSRRGNPSVGGNGDPAWMSEGGSPYSSYTNTPMSTTFSHHGTPAASPYFAGSQPSLSPYARTSPFPPSPAPAPGSAGYGHTPPPPPSSGPYQSHFPPSPLPGQSHFPPSPLPGQSAFPSSPLPGQGGFPRGNLSVPASPAPPASPGFSSGGVGLGVGGSGVPPPPKRSSNLRNEPSKKDD